MTDHHDRETYVVNNSGGSAGWIFAIVVAFILAFGAWFIFADASTPNTDVSVDIATPEKPGEPEQPAPDPDETTSAVPTE